MAKKERTALAFVVRKDQKKPKSTVLYAVVGMPERTTAPKETAHYILFDGVKNHRYKMKINTVTFAKTPEGKIDRKKVQSFTPNFEEVSGKLLNQLYEKCCPAFKRTFKI